MRLSLIIFVLLILLLPSCTQSKVKEGSPPVQNISETINSEPLLVNPAPVDDYVIIGGYKTDDRLSRVNRATDVLLVISETRSTDLSGIEQYVNLEGLHLYLWERDDIDFSPLKSLPQLQYIHIRGSALTAIPDLGGIPSLAILELSANSLTSLNGLEKVPQLERLYISDARVLITDTSALRYLKNLQELYIITSFFNIDLINLADLPKLELMAFNDYGELNLMGIEQLHQLEVISFSNCGELNLMGIGQLHQLKKLRLEIGVSKATGKQSVFSNIQEIGRMTSLRELYLDEVITSVEFLASNVNLERLELVSGMARPGYYTGETLPLDVAPLGNLKKLKYLAIRGFELINAHVLDTLPELKTINTALFDVE